MHRLKFNIALILLVLIGVFAAQNAASVEYRFLAWAFELRRSAVVAGCVATGIIIGWLASAARQSRS